MYALEQFFIILTISAVVALAARFTRLPYTIALVIVGLILGTLDIPMLHEAKAFITNNQVFHTVVIAIFLPALLGEASIKLSYHEFKKNKKPILLLAFGGTLLTFILVGFGTYWFLGESLVVAFTFAALMSATDPISVIGLFKTLGVHKRLSILVEGESLLNDGVAVVLFTIASTSLITFLNEGTLGLFHGLERFAWVVIGGVFVGTVVGYVLSKVIALFDDYPLEIIFSMICFFGSYFLSEKIHVSGVISVVVAGMIFGNYGAKIGMSPLTKLSISSFWDAISMVANSVIFLMIGLEINHINLTNQLLDVILAIVIVVLARVVSVYGILLFEHTLPKGWRHIINWGGLRGSLSIALALSLPNDFPHRDDILVFSFSVVVFSLLVQGLSMKPILRRLKITENNPSEQQYQSLIADIYRYEVSLDEIKKAQKEGVLQGTSYDQIKNEYDTKLKTKRDELQALYEANPDFKHQQLDSVNRRLYLKQTEAIKTLENKDVISSELSERKIKDIITILGQKGE